MLTPARHDLTQRRLTPELMDDPDIDPRELERALQFLRFVNRWLGGTSASLRPFRHWQRTWPSDETIRILDVGTGSADMPLVLLEWAKRMRLSIHVTAIDRHQQTIEFARRLIGDRAGLKLVQCDALKLLDQFESHAFDYVHAGLFLHHLSDVDVMTVLSSMGRLARRGIVWNDLLRTSTAMLAVKAVTALPGVPKTVRHDAIVSIEAGFLPDEAIEIAKRVDLADLRCRTHMLHRFTLTGRCKPASR